MPLQRHQTQANVLAPRPPPLRQLNPIPERRPDPPTTSVKVEEQPKKAFEPIKLHPKNLNRLCPTLLLNNPSLTSTRTHTYRPSIKGGIIILKDLSKIPEPIPESARKVSQF
ncbi:uncharacterized protein MELLADRAFT_66117 [Melampsora larici-populina 98AG31]|uniref:Uncharacterized protein n=1 Tax=Melampsora larici-populina (strain 98AG31 / pathotype 3-4-7) TaxID=747676 RepID=F4RXY2_MELLP|nr:uncharacterized protein MELLADRAFT_66117 [Melampsora larici-populina 98AG31]EGG02822.1 hypothetical protein MELLADRAFT_66117 [Melampsora larici-populina 98AG31]